jgi:metal-dependent hydrolase (beta-lactamase superfamily II)
MNGDRKEHKILLDTAAEKEALIFSIDRLEISLRDLEAIVLSHGHSDHSHCNRTGKEAQTRGADNRPSICI